MHIEGTLLGQISCCLCLCRKVGCVLPSPAAVGEYRVTVLAGSCCPLTSRRDFKMCELEETCPVSHVTCDLLSKNQRRKVGGKVPESTLPACRFSGKERMNLAESSHCCPGRDFGEVSQEEQPPSEGMPSSSWDIYFAMLALWYMDHMFFQQPASACACKSKQHFMQVYLHGHDITSIKTQ